MLRGFRWFALAAVVAIAALVGPTVALADSCDPSVTSIYYECTPTAKGPSHPKHPATPPAPKPYVPTPYVPPAKVGPTHQQVSHAAKHAVRVVGGAFQAVQKRFSYPHHAGAIADPVLASAPAKQSSLGSAFDLGVGPMILFALLAGTVLVLLGTGGVRSWRNRHRV
jgi:hypothetical protein